MEQAQTPPTPQPTEQPPQPSIPPPSSTISSSSPNPNPNPNPNSNPNPNPNTKPLTSLQSHHHQQQQQAQQQQQQQQSLHSSQTRPPFNRTWQPQSSHFSHFSSHLHSLPSTSSSSLPSTSGSSAPSLSSSASSSISVPPGQRGGIAIGVPAAHHPSPTQPQSAPFSPSFGQQFGGLGRNAVTVPDSVANSNTSQMRQPAQGYQSMGMMGSLGSGSQMRAGGVPAHHQQRPVQPSLRPQSTPNNQSAGTQNFQGHGLLRVPSAGSPGSPSLNTSQSMQSHNQPWLSSGSQGKPPLPSPSFRPQMNPQSLQQRSHTPQQHQHPLSTASQQQQQMSSAQQPQQPLPSHQQQEHSGQQFPSSRVPQSLSHQQQITRVQGSGNQKPSSPAMAPPSTVQSGPQNRTASADTGESGNRILSKRSIHELVNQIDPLERLDPEVEDILVDIADEFVDSITTFGCSLAKHRKSNTLEAKDILLHLERNWNMTLPGFSGDEIKIYKKPIANDIHRERLAVIKKSIVGTEAANTKSSAGQAGGSAKGHLTKAPTNAMDSPNPKTREVA